MKIQKWLVLLLVFGLLSVCLLSCGNTPTESTDEACTHPNMKETTTEATCTVDGYTELLCEDCGYRQTETLSASHDYRESYDAETGEMMTVCSRCGEGGYLVSGGESIELSGYFGGDAVFTARAVEGESKVEFWADDALLGTMDCAKDEITLPVTALEDKAHTFRFVNTGENDVFIGKEDMDGKLNRKDSVIVEVLAGKKDSYSSFNLYVQTSDVSGDYYIRYKMQYEYSDVRNKYASNTTHNVSNYRVKTAQLVKITDVRDTAVVAEDILNVLESGEISLAFKQNNPDHAVLTEEALTALGSATQAVDFVGGYHGDERLESAELFADGEKVNIFGQTKKLVIPCTYVNFDQTTTIYAWGTSSEDSFGKEMVRHTQNFIFDSNGIRDLKTVTWLDDGYEIGNFFFQMFTMYRETAGKTVCEKLEAFDENGKSLGTATVPIPVTQNTAYLDNLNNRLIRYSSDVSGVSAEAGFEIIDGSVVPNVIYVSARSYGDNKLYASFESATNGKNPKKNETWAIEAYYNIDYVDPAAAES